MEKKSQNLRNAIDELTKQAITCHNGLAAQQFSQAVCNLTIALRTLRDMNVD